MSGFFEICINLGVLLATLVNFSTQKIEAGWGWRLSLSLAALPAFCLLIGALFFLPETPTSIIQRGCHREEGKCIQEATLVLQKIRGTSNVDKELSVIVSTVAASRKATELPFHILLRRNHRPLLVIVFALSVFQLMTGINFVNFYNPILFRTIGFKESKSLLLAFVTRVTGTVSTIAAMTIVDRFGRRKLFILGGVPLLASQVVLGGILAAKLKDHGGEFMSSEYSYAVLVALCVLVASFSLSWGPLPWLVISEIFPLELRSAGQSIFGANFFILSFVLAQSMLSLLCHIKYGLFFLFAGFVLLMTLFSIFFLPETKGVPLEQMGRVWKKHWFWRRFVETNEAEEEIHNINNQIKPYPQLP